MVGNLVLEEKINTNKIDVRSLSKGMYLLTVYSGKYKSVKKMIIK
jgi:hypothetical protein